MADQVRASGVKTHGMLWNCPACATPRLLGSTHLYCPVCGDPQDPQTLYSPANEDWAAIAEHSLVGRDLLCLSCQTPNSAAANNCGRCGCPLAGAREMGYRGAFGRGEGFAGDSGAFVQASLQRARQTSAQRQLASNASEQHATAKLTRTHLIIVGVSIAIGLLMFQRTRKREIEVEVTGHSWSRTIEIEQFRELKATAGCDELPRGAKLLRERSATNECDYRIDTWQIVRTMESTGNGLEPEPSWPEVRLRKTGQGNCILCEREGARVESYMVSFSHEGRIESCPFDLATWQSIGVGQRFRAPHNPEIDSLDCASLVASGG